MENISIKLNMAAQMLGGTVTGNEADVTITSFATSPFKATKDDLVFLYDEKYISKIDQIMAKAFILPLAEKERLSYIKAPVLWVERPRFVLKQMLSFIEKPKYKPEKAIHETAVIDFSAKIGKGCSIGANVYVGPNSEVEDGVVLYPNIYVGKNVKIGKESVIGPSCTIFDNSIIGKKVILHAGVVVGGDGFSYITEEESNLEKIRKGKTNLNTNRLYQHKIPTLGNVIIHDFVEIGSNTTVDAGNIESTVIGEGTKIDNLCMIAHNVKIGKDCLIIAKTAIGGSTVIKDRVVIGGGALFADHMEVGEDSAFAGGATLHGKTNSQSVYIGYDAVTAEEYIRNKRFQKRLPRKVEGFESQIKILEEKIKLLEEKLKVQV